MATGVRVSALLLLATVLAAACAGQRGPASAAITADPPSSVARRLAVVLANAGCRQCHSAQGEASDTRLVFPEPGAPAAAVDRAAAALRELIDPDDPARSRLLRKPTKRMMHEGGQKIAPGSPEEHLLAAWLTEAGRARRQDTAALRAVLVAAPPSLPWPVRYQGTPGRLRRLSRDEIVATLELLTGSAPSRDELPDEPRTGHGLLVTSGVPLHAGEILALKLVMRDFAAKVAQDVLAASGCAATEQAQKECLDAWFGRFAERAFRRAPAPDERALLRSVLETAAGDSREGDLSAVEALLTAIFQSPSFLYRSEIGRPIPGQPTLRALGPEEIAARVSYLATLAPPDAELIASARGGRLTDGAERVRHLDRLAATEPGQRARAVFVLEWLGANDARIGLKSPRYLRGLGKDLEPSIRQSAQAAIRQVLAGGAPPTVGALLSTTAYLTDAAVDQITRPDGKRASGDTGATGRLGLLMHPQVLAAHTKENGSSPFQIGAFVREALLCEPVPAPPPDAAASARTDEPPGLSTRERLEHRTSAGRACTACHRTFAPLGYAFLPFDPVGRWIAADPAGKPWDLSGSVATFSGVPLAFSSPADLARKLAEHPQVHGCFAQAALQWTVGRALVPEDEEMITSVGQVARRTRGDIAEIFRAIVAAPGFARAVAPR